MFGFFASQDKKMRDTAANWLEVADKIWCFRRDVLTAKESAELQQHTTELRQRVAAKADAAKLKLSIESLEEVLRRTGGAIYPKSALVENIEFLLVAAIVIIGVRTFFVQPFKIPTNSMWPTFNGMTSEIFPTKADEPGPAAVALRAVAYGAWPHRLDAPVDGEVLVPLANITESRPVVFYTVVPGRTWLVLPTQLREYTLFVDDHPVRFRVPLDYDFDWVAADAFFGGAQDTRQAVNHVLALRAAGKIVRRELGGQVYYCVRTGKYVKKGERVLAFDELTGDQLFVDRVSYNFVRPKVGQGFVFATAKIPGIHGDQYYVKRLVGTPGDTLQIREPMIYRNGRPIEGADAFRMNNHREGLYRGYFNGPAANNAQYLLTPEETLTVPADRYFAMGDNSGFSSDSRYWGFVPAKEVMGRPMFIYFPFTKHWGPSR